MYIYVIVIRLKTSQQQDKFRFVQNFIVSCYNRINLVYMEESRLVGITLLSLEFHSLGICHHQFPIGRSIEMPFRNHPSRLIESVTLMNIG